jgi:isopenicillin-N epimerase
MAQFNPAAGPADDAYWRMIAAQYDLPLGVVQLENGNFGSMARPVSQAYERALERVNRDTSLYARRAFDPDLARIRDRVAAALGVGADEIAFTRGATEALMALITGYNRLRAGDQVLFADLDYDSTQAAITWLQSRRRVEAVKISLPEPATH